MKVTNPYTLEAHEVAETPSVQELFKHAQQDFTHWSAKTVAERVKLLTKALSSFQAQSEQIARVLSEEVGKPIALSRFEIERTLEEWEYMLAHAEEFLRPEKLDGAEVHFSALGVVAVISPWNFPALLPLRGIVPALLAGNTVICKPSELSPRTAVAFSKAFEGVAPLFIAIGGKEMGAEVVRLPVRAIAFTGSTAVGKSIAKEASNSLKRIILELGGLDAAIVLADADIAVAAGEIVRNNARNTGQVCNAIKRVLVHESVYQQFLVKAAEVLEQIVYGDPLDEKTEVGPLVSEVQYNRVQSFLDDAISKGAKPISRTLQPQGFLFPQVLLTDVPQSAKLLHEEPFGPLLPVIPFSSEAEAVKVANDTSFGLTASVWTRDSHAARRIASQLDVGLVRHNTHAAMKSGIPWGGAKESGVGRMKTKEGLREFTNVKVIA
jgi:acyl-CoA reductase-like NAD-dependent aldehyde dehydrogenase